MELFWSMTVRENIELAVESLHVRDDPLTQLGVVGGGRRVSAIVADRAEELMAFVGLNGAADRLASEISTGQGRLVELARALAREPRVLLLDEPSSGLDPRESAAFGELLTELVAERGIALLMVEHDMSLVLNICDWIHVLDFGKPLTEGTPADVRASEAVREAYLGQAATA
jgi:ABC-type branched-subunit amino acid transport system ATPase component